MDEKEIEELLIRSKVFKLYKSNAAEKKEPDSISNNRNEHGKEIYSLYNLCKMDTEQLHQMIFMLDHIQVDKVKNRDNLQVEDNEEASKSKSQSKYY